MESRNLALVEFDPKKVEQALEEVRRIPEVTRIIDQRETDSKSESPWILIRFVFENTLQKIAEIPGVKSVLHAQLPVERRNI